MSAALKEDPPAPLLSLRGLAKSFDVSAPWVTRVVDRRPREILRAVAGIDLDIAPGMTYGLVGESGCGKSTVARMAAGLIEPSGGTISYRGRSLDELKSSEEGRQLRREIQMVFQDPFASLNPRWRVEQTVGDPLLAFGIVKSRAEMREEVARLLTEVGLTPEDGRKFPHQFSGGQRQRIAIARALATRPSLLVCDEPTSALDVSVQAQILNLMRELQARFGLTYLFISHNLAVIDHMADRIGVMYLGRIVEERDKPSFFDRPLHPYSRMLVGTIPSLKSLGTRRQPPKGEVPSPISPPPGCAFHPRCPLANERCRTDRPALLPAPGGQVACHAVEEGRTA